MVGASIGTTPVTATDPSDSGTANTRGRVLVLTPWFPYPQDNGSRQRLWAMIGGLRERYIVDMVALVDEPVDDAYVEATRSRCDNVEVVARRHFEPRSPRAIAAFFHRHPRAVVATYTPEMRAAVDRLTQAHRYDAVVVSQIHVARYARQVRGVPRVLDDFEVAIIRDASPDASGRERFRQALTWWKMRRYARDTVRLFDATVVVSEAERNALVALAPKVNAVVVPNGVDLERNTPRQETPEPATMIHAGALGFFANLEGISWFVDDVFPRVRAARPGARLIVTGRTGDAQVPRRDGVEYTGYLDDIRPAIGRARCSVVPLRRGGGTRLKVLESLALGTPVVSTPKGVEGLDLAPGEEVMVGATADEFARAVVAMLDDDDLRERLRASGRAAVEARYGWDPIVERFVSLVDRVARTR